MVTQEQRIEQERQWWKILTELSDKNNIHGFYSVYAKYLEWNNIISPQRQILHKMALVVTGLIDDNAPPNEL